MPVNAIMLVQLSAEIDDDALDTLRKEFVRDMVRDTVDKSPDFYSDGPLARVELDGYMPLAQTSNGRNWLNVRLCRAVYEPGYERGYLPLFVWIAEWLEARLPGARVWYGNDCGGEETCNPFGPGERQLLKEYYDRFACVPYGTGERSAECRDATDAYYRVVCAWRNAWIQSEA